MAVGYLWCRLEVQEGVRAPIYSFLSVSEFVPENFLDPAVTFPIQ